MSGSFRRRHSKWDHNDSEAVTENFQVKAQTRRPREQFSPTRGSQRHDSRSKERMMTWDREENHARISTGSGESKQYHSRSPRDGRGRLHSRSRSRSRSPSHYLRRGPAENDRNRSKSGVSAKMCREFVAGRCRRGSICHFLHEDVQPYDRRQALDSSYSDDLESRPRKAGGSKYSPDDNKDYAPRTVKSTNICSEFLKGRCRRGASCRYEHRDHVSDVSKEDLIDDVQMDRDGYSHRNHHDRETVDVFEKGPIDDVHRGRDNPHRSRDNYSLRNHDEDPSDVFEKGPIDDPHRSRDTYSHRNHDCEHANTFEKRPVDDVHRDRDRDRDRDKDNFLRRRDTYTRRNHDRESADVFEKRPVDDVSRDRGNDVFEKGPVGIAYRDRDNDHRVRDVYKNRDCESHKRGGTLCKFFASGNCTDGNRCRFVHEVRERLSPERRSHDDKLRSDHKVENNQAWVGPSWTDMAKMTRNLPSRGWGEEQNQAMEVSEAKSGNKSGNHDRLNMKDSWVTSVTNDGFQMQDENSSLLWVADNNVPSMDLSESRGVENVSGDMEISPRDIKQHPVSLPNVSFGTARPDAVGEAFCEKPYSIGLQEPKVYNEPFPAPNPYQNEEKPNAYHGDGTNVINQSLCSSPIPTMGVPPHPFPTPNPSQNEEKPNVYDGEGRNVINQSFCSNPIPTTSVPPYQDFFQTDQIVGVRPSQHFMNPTMNVPPQQPFFQTDQTMIGQPNSGLTPVTQGQAQFPSGGVRVELSHNPSSFLNNVAAEPHLVNASVAGRSGVSNEQLAQLTTLSASLAQLLENRQQHPQSASVSILTSMSNIPGPPVFDSMMQTDQVPETSKEQYDPICDSLEPNVNVEPKTENKVVDDEGGNILSKDDEKVNEIEGSRKDLENRPNEDVPVDEGEDANKSKDTKAIRPFKFALAEFVKELLKPSWKDGQVSKDAYKTIVKKVVDKIIDTQGLQFPRTKEKIDQYLSCSQPKIDKLVQAYVGKFQKT